MNRHYRALQRLIEKRQRFSWLLPLLEESDALIRNARHGDLPAWLAALAELPPTDGFFDGEHSAPEIGHATPDPEALAASLGKLHPWRKGPLRIGGVHIDTEWRSDLKWERLAPHLDLQGHWVLDVGSGNGYYGWRMLGAGAECVVGVDPTLVFVMQWLAARHFAGDAKNFVLPLGVERLPADAGGFDTVFSMGVLYHRRDPVSHLRRLKSLVRPGGNVVLETLVLESAGDHVLVPEGRYARMRNVWAIPALGRLFGWLEEAGLPGAEVLDVSQTTTAEQRTTEWMRFESLHESLDPDNPERTAEGHPAPVRAALLVRTPI